MGTIKLDKDEMLRIAGELSVLKDRINNILNKTQETENILRRENTVSTYIQERKLSETQDLAYNLVREFDKISDNFYQAAKAYESSEDRINNLVNIDKNNDIKNIIAINSMENTYFNNDNSNSKEKEETTFDKLKELTQEGWKLLKDYCGVYISVMDFMKDVCDNINTSIDEYIEDHEEFFAEFNAEHPTLSIIFTPLQELVALGDSTVNFLKEMTFGLGSNVLGMLSDEYKGLLENPGETLDQNMKSILMIKAILCPTSKEEFEIQNKALSGIWKNIKTDFNSEVMNGNPYTASRYVYNLVLEIGSLFFGAGELKAASGVKKADNVLDGLRALDKVSDAEKISNEFNIAQTGGRELSVSEYLKQVSQAEDMYTNFRNSKTDIKKIAENTGVPEWRVKRIKDHIFYNEHIKEFEVGRFDADYDMANAWERLINGEYVKSDLDLLNHEIFESKFESIFNTDYRTAHDKTVESGRNWVPEGD